MNAVLQAFARPSCLATPRRLTDVSAWQEHIPFAMNLVEVLAPRVLVELGTHAGDSYCAMCQAVDTAGLPSRCYAVDTWEGDAHAGVYGPEILASLRAHHDPLYGRFSRLVQSTFADAARHFDDASIDLLHVDGLHTYEAVRQDFETWLPKLTPAGVVLLHDTNVRERGFGVWRLWEEIRVRYPHFEFAHGHGLGVAAVGGSPPAALVPLLDASPADAEGVRAFYFELGLRLSLQAELERSRRALDAMTAHRDAISARAAQAERTAQDLVVARDALQRRVDALGAELAAERARLDDLAGSRAMRIASTWWRLRDRITGRG